MNFAMLQLVRFEIRDPPAVLIGRMAADLVNLGVLDTETNAIRALMGRYGYGEIIAFAGEALVEAQRRKVAPAMADSPARRSAPRGAG